MVAGLKPLTSALTVWSADARAVVLPWPTTWVKPLSLAICQLTSVSGPLPEPGEASGIGVTRVHSRTPSGRGSPDATPWWNAGPSAAWARGAAASGARAAVAAAALTTVRRLGAKELSELAGELSGLCALFRLVTGDYLTDQ